MSAKNFEKNEKGANEKKLILVARRRRRKLWTIFDDEINDKKNSMECLYSKGKS